MRAISAGAVMAIVFGAVVSAAPAADQRIEQAMAAKVEAQQNAARDRLIANNVTALTNDSLTPVIGNAKADVAIIEFFDYVCPYCKAVEPRLEAVLKKDKGVKLVVKEFPILTPESLVAARASLASVKQGKYAAYHQAMMNFRGRLDEASIFDMAKEAGLDVARLKKDMQAPEINDEIIANFNLARAIRVFQTPAFIVGGHLLTGASADIDFPKVVASARAK